MFYKKTNQLYWLWISIAIFILDQLTKFWASHWLINQGRVPILPCVNFILMHNTGAAFSFLGWANGWQRWLFIGISVGISIYLLMLLHRGNLSKWVGFSLALIIGGAVGNLYDRLTLGYVVDFIDFCIGNWHFATFNLADAAISIGATIWLIATGLQSKKKTSCRL